MDTSIMHMAMELSSTCCLFFISWLNIRYAISGKYSFIVATGTFLAGFTDMLHAFTAALYPDLLQHWVPFSWAGGRLILLATFITIYICHDSVCSKRLVVGTLITPLIATSLAGVLQHYNIISLSWIYQSFNIFSIDIYRPADFALMLGWIFVAFGLQNKSYMLFPPNLYWVFMIQGILIHAILAFGSKESLDMASMIAHSIKISEYYIFILVYLIYKSQLDNIPRINTIRQSSNSREIPNGIARAVE